MDINSVHRADWERRRKIRLAQVRDQSKALAKTIRDRVHGAVEIQQERCETARNITEHKFKSLALNKLKSDFNYLIQDVGNGYSVASAQNNPSVVLAEKRLIDRCKAISRGAEAEKRQQQIQEKQQMDKDMRDRRIHFNKTVEKIRSKLITSVQNVDDDSTHKYNIKGHNECFLIPSQVTLNESNIMNQNFIRKPSKPWSMVISSKENQTKKLPQSTTYNENKENINDVSKFSKLETDMKTYETLILELKKLSAEEQNIRNKLFPNSLKEVPITCQNNVHLESQEKTQPKEINRKKQLSNGRIKSNEIKKQITEIRLNESSTSTSICISSSTSTSTNYEQPTNKTIRFEKENKKKNQQPSNKLNHKEKMSSGKPLQNINNTLQRIKNKKQLLVKEITAGTSVKSSDADIKKMKTVPTSFKSSPILKRCCAGGNSHKEIPVNYAQLPDSFYDNQLDILKEQVSKKKIKSLDFKSHVSINSNLMTYINTLLKMSPSDVDNLSISSCSSVKLEDSILQHSERDFYCKMLNCISKCLNSDISDINQDTEFTSPKNIKLLNRLQQLTDYYLEKTHEMKNICNESSQILSDTLNAKTHKTDSDTIKENSSINLSSDSSVDEEYILANLNKLLQKKGIINSDKEWPVFKHDDGDRSVTDQLLDIHPYKSHDM